MIEHKVQVKILPYTSNLQQGCTFKLDKQNYTKQGSTWRAAAPTRQVSTCHLTCPPSLITRSLSSSELAIWSFNIENMIDLAIDNMSINKCIYRANILSLLLPSNTLLRAMACPFLHKIVRQSPALATMSISLTNKAEMAVHPGCQFFPWPFLLGLWKSSSFRNALSVSMKAAESASDGLCKTGNCFHEIFLGHLGICGQLEQH